MRDKEQIFKSLKTALRRLGNVVKEIKDLPDKDVKWIQKKGEKYIKKLEETLDNEGSNII